MNKKALIVLLAVLAVLIALPYAFSLSPRTAPILSEREAIDAAIAEHPELAAYETTDLPPSLVESERVASGWNLGFIRRGSGLPGILDAKCYAVSDEGVVTESGEYSRDASSPVESLDLATCQPAAAVSLGECYVGGCSGQICSDEEGVASNCEYRPEYSCYKKTSVCERQATGQCGWTETPALNACLDNAR